MQALQKPGFGNNATGARVPTTCGTLPQAASTLPFGENGTTDPGVADGADDTVDSASYVDAVLQPKNARWDLFVGGRWKPVRSPAGSRRFFTAAGNAVGPGAAAQPVRRGGLTMVGRPGCTRERPIDGILSTGPLPLPELSMTQMWNGWSSVVLRTTAASLSKHSRVAKMEAPTVERRQTRRKGIGQLLRTPTAGHGNEPQRGDGPTSPILKFSRRVFCTPLRCCEIFGELNLERLGTKGASDINRAPN